MRNLLANRLNANPIIDLESESFDVIASETELNTVDGSKAIEDDLHNIEMLSDAGVVLNQLVESTEGLIKEGVGAAVATEIMTPALIGVLETIDSQIAIEATVSLEADVANAVNDDGKNFIKRIKDFVSKIWEAIKGFVTRILDWMKSTFNNFFDTATVLNKRCKDLLTRVKAAASWTDKELIPSYRWLIDKELPTEQSFLKALQGKAEAVKLTQKAAEEDIKISAPVVASVLALFDKATKETATSVATLETDGFYAELKATLGAAKTARAENTATVERFFESGGSDRLLPIGMEGDHNYRTLNYGAGFKLYSQKDVPEGKVATLSKNGCIKALEHLIDYTDVVMKLSGVFKKTNQNAETSFKQVEAKIRQFERTNSANESDGLQARGHKIRNAFDMGFSWVRTDFNYMFRIWSNVLKAASLRSARNGFDFIARSSSMSMAPQNLGNK